MTLVVENQIHGNDIITLQNHVIFIQLDISRIVSTKYKNCITCTAVRVIKFGSDKILEAFRLCLLNSECFRIKIVHLLTRFH